VRRLALIGGLVAVAAVIALVVGASAQGSDSYKFDVIFDDARGLISGQLVKIAGADAGSIDNVTVTSQYKARVQATISGPFQFHTNASCIIRPDGLIAENYLECDPGTASKPLLPSVDGLPPTVPVTHTSEPVSLLDLFNIFNVPTRERFQVLLDELGIATAGRGDDINAILQRANPTLQLAQRVIGILNGQSSELATAIDATSTIAAQGATHTAAVQSFLQNMSGLVKQTADHAGNLSQDINKLPALLSAAQPALSQLDTVARDGTPLLKSINTSVPYLNAVDRDLGPFTAIAKPALGKLATAVSDAIPAVKQATPLVATISNYLKASAPSTKEFAGLTVNLLQQGFSENFLSVLYYVGTALSHYDSDSHMLASLTVFPDGGGCLLYATKESSSPDCQAHYGQQQAYTPAARHHAASAKGTATTTTSSTTSTSSTTTPTTPTTTSPLGTLPSQLAGGIGKVLSGVGSALGGVTGGLSKTLSGVGGSGQSANSTSTTTGTTTNPQSSGLQNLINYLFK
jgi:ABC-type transporter Mla subunit MlaD